MGWVFNAPDGTPTDGPKITVITSIFSVCSLVVVCLRYYVRKCFIKALGPDDWAILVAWVASCEYGVGTIVETRWGLGMYSLDSMPQENLYNFSLIQYIGAPFYVVSLYGFKLSLLLSYIRFFGYASNLYRKFTIGVIVTITMAHIVFALVFLLLCQPITKQWNPSVTEGKCIDGLPFYTSFSVLTIIFDVAIMLLPFPILIQSKIQNRKKIVLLGLFALGIFITIIQALRFRTIQSLQNYLDSSKVITWSIVECNLGIIVTCIPTLSPLVKYFAEKSKLSNASASNHNVVSSYGLQTWGRGSRVDGGESRTEIRGNPRNDSTELILDTHGVMRKTEVLVSLG